MFFSRVVHNIVPKSDLHEHTADEPDATTVHVKKEETQTYQPGMSENASAEQDVPKVTMQKAKPGPTSKDYSHPENPRNVEPTQIETASQRETKREEELQERRENIHIVSHKHQVTSTVKDQCQAMATAPVPHPADSAAVQHPPSVDPVPVPVEQLASATTLVGNQQEADSTEQRPMAPQTPVAPVDPVDRLPPRPETNDPSGFFTKPLDLRSYDIPPLQEPIDNSAITPLHAPPDQQFLYTGKYCIMYTLYGDTPGMKVIRYDIFLFFFYGYTPGIRLIRHDNQINDIPKVHSIEVEFVTFSYT